MRKNWRYYLLLIRPGNLGIIALTQILFMLAATHVNFLYFRWPESLTVILSVIFTAAGGYVINDIFDIEEDQINKPEKRIIHKHISTRQGKVFYAILTVIGIFLGFITGWGMGFLCIAIAILLYFYSSDLKGTFLQGNLLVAFLTGAVVYTAARGVFTIYSGFFGEYALLAFLITMAREIVKDTEDLEGDLAQEYRTFPIKYGAKKSMLLASLFLGGVNVLLVFLMVTSGKTVFIAYTSLAAFLPIGYLFYLLATAKEKKDYSRISRWMKITMITGLCSVLFI